MAKQKIPKQYALPNWFWVTCVAIVVTIFIYIGYFFYWQTGWPGYLTALTECDNRPPVQAKSFLRRTYIKPGDERYRVPGENGYRTYFCTEDEAKAAGFTHQAN